MRAPRLQCISVEVALALALVAAPARAQQQPAPPPSPLAAYPGFGHDHQGDEARFRRQELAREQAIARCMQRAGFEYTPMPAIVNPSPPATREALATREHPNARYVASLTPAERTRYNLTLYGVPDPNDEESLWDPRSPTGGGCWGEAMRAVPSVYAARSQLTRPYLAMRQSIAQDARVRAAEQRWSECMRARGYQYPSPLALHAEVDRAAIAGRTGRAMAELERRNQEARAPARQCSGSSGLDSTITAVRAEKEREFVREHRDVLERHRERQRAQVLPPP